MKFSRLTTAAALSSVLVLSACSGSDDSESAEGEGATSTAGAAAGSGEDSSATENAAVTDEAAATDNAGSTAGADAADTTEMTTDEGLAVRSVDEAEEIANDILEKRHKAELEEDGDEQIELQKRAYMGSARDAVEGLTVLQQAEVAEIKVDEKPPEANVLSISREDGEKPELMLVQTVPESGVPWLHLMESRTGEKKDFRIIWEAQMLPDTELPSFDARSAGTPVLRSGKGELAESPKETLSRVADYTEWPQPEEVPKFRTHGYGPAVRDAAEQQAKSVEGQAELVEKNWLVTDDIKTLMFEDGTAFVIGSMLRDTTFTVGPDSVLTPPDTFAAFQDGAELTDEAVLRTAVFVGMHVPTEGEDFDPEMIAAREQLVDAWGE